MNKILKSGCGYWDITKYPYGGCFKRPSEDKPVTVIKDWSPNPNNEVQVQFEDGTIGVCRKGALKD